MKKFLLTSMILGVAWGLPLVAPTRAEAFKFGPVPGCGQDYVGHELGNLTRIVSFSMQVMKEVDSLSLPGAQQGALGPKLIGGAITVSKLYTSAFASPEALLNTILGVVCLQVDF